MIEIRLPELSASMTEATVVAWRKNVGEAVRIGEVLVELETEKSSVELEAESAGVLSEILVPDGTEGVGVGTVLARLSEVEGEAPRATSPGAEPSTGPPPPPAAAMTPLPPPHRPVDPAAATPAPTPAISMTPLAQRIAAQARLDPAILEASGRRGRLGSADVERVLGAGPRRVPRAAPAGPLQPQQTPPHRDEHLGTARRRAAERLAEAKRSAPHFYLDVECDAERLHDLRNELNASRGDEQRPELTLNDLLVRALGLAMREVPAANVEWRDGDLRHYQRVDVAVAVASERGLVTPVVREAAARGLAEIARDLRDLVSRARTGRLRPEEYSGGTTTLSNLGMYGVRRLFPVLNLPQACILGIGSVDPRVVVRDGAPAVRRTLVVTLAADHRAVDGATGAELLVAFRGFLEDPLSMLL